MLGPSAHQVGPHNLWSWVSSHSLILPEWATHNQVHLLFPGLTWAQELICTSVKVTVGFWGTSQVTLLRRSTPKPFNLVHHLYTLSYACINYIFCGELFQEFLPQRTSPRVAWRASTSKAFSYCLLGSLYSCPVTVLPKEQLRGLGMQVNQ